MAAAPFIKPDRPSPEQIAAWKRMTFAQKLDLADQLRTSALRLREAWLRKQARPRSGGPAARLLPDTCASSFDRLIRAYQIDHPFIQMNG